jgi:hypothetical protein
MNPTTVHSSAVVGQLVLIEADPIRERIRHAIAGFLAGYSGTTLEAYRLGLRGWITWLDAAFLDPFVVERAERRDHASVDLDRRPPTVRGDAERYGPFSVVTIALVRQPLDLPEVPDTTRLRSVAADDVLSVRGWSSSLASGTRWTRSPTWTSPGLPMSALSASLPPKRWLM